ICWNDRRVRISNYDGLTDEINVRYAYICKGKILNDEGRTLLEKTMRLNYLLDFYHTLLTPKQREYMEMYYLEDYSLVEIANHADVSRQAVYDNIKRTEDILESYEQSIQLYEKFQMRISLLNALEKSIDEEQEEKIHSLIDQLKELG